ncbi:MerR family transcriptional regulator [uncultured Nocardioides sp.]|uniref:MerR family transcriptional regulator n=1 Tax=uncultured Nocardioides sp. TaxID=198441 RepID=UPI002636494F|nr:MerR family transcriptional regulator [uncultured Nocardioides sp.]
MSTPLTDEAEGLMTVDELAAACGLTVRTTRYYASLGLVPPPVRRGRMAFYDQMHLAHLELVRALQDHGFTLQAIEGFIQDLPAEANLEDLALQRAMLTSWSARPTERLTLGALEKRAGRPLAPDDLALLESMAVLDRDGDHFLSMPNFSVGVELMSIDIPRESMQAASDAIRRHMETLVTELTDILHAQVIDPYRRGDHAPADGERMEQTVARLRRLTLEAVVTGFQRAANAVIRRSLVGD